MHSQSGSFVSEVIPSFIPNIPSRKSTRALNSPGFLLTLGSVALIAAMFVGGAESFVMGSRPVSKRSFFDIQCKGVYDKGIFAKLDRICDDCYNLYREPQLHSLCRKSCFSTESFTNCLTTLELDEEIELYQGLINKVNAPAPKSEFTPNPNDVGDMISFETQS